MLVIRFFRQGKKNQPSFKIVVTDKRKSSTGGRFVEEVGFYNPITKEKNLKAERIKYWISVGAKPLATVTNLLISGKIIEGKKIPVHKKSKKTKEEKAPEAPVAAKPAEPSSVKATEGKEKPKEEVEETPAVEKPIEEKPKEEEPKNEVKEEEKKE